MDIGTDKVGEDIRQEIPHHMIDIYPVSKTFSAGEFAAQSIEAIRSTLKRNKVPIVVGPLFHAAFDLVFNAAAGGTAFYLRMMMQGSPGTPPSTESMKAQVCRVLWWETDPSMAD